jgi:hypothetical protein
LTGLDLPPEENDWLDEAIAIAILALQFGNSAARRASLSLTGSARAEIRQAILSMGSRPGARAVNRAVSRIRKALERSGRITRRVILADIKTLISVERKNLPEGIDKPTLAALVALMGLRKPLGRTLDQYIDSWLVRIPQERMSARLRHLASVGTDPKQIWTEITAELSRVSKAAGNVASTVLADVSTAVRTTAAGTGQRMIWISVMDSKTTIQCINLDGDTWLVGEDHLYPPIHINCRSSVGIHMGGNPGKRSYIEWLERQPKATQDTVLGVERAAAWRDGRLTVQEMVDATRTRTLTLDALKKLGRL